MQSHLGVSIPKVRKRRAKNPPNSIKTQQKAFNTYAVDGGYEDEKAIENTSGQSMLYDQVARNTSQDIIAVNDPTGNGIMSLQSSPVQNSSTKLLPSVGAFTVQCSTCFKWRLVPSKEKYEEIRESILQEPFICDRAREWRPNVSCDNPSDIDQDGSRLWAMDKPNIAQPPPGWERLLRIRGEGSTRFADIYYIAPSGKRLRSLVEVEKYLLQHPEYIRDGVNLTQFSFLTPKPLQENYVRKRHARLANIDGAGNEMLRPLEPDEVNPLSCAGPPTMRELQSGKLGFSIPHEPPSFYAPTNGRPAKMKPVRRSFNKTCKSPVKNQPEFKMDDAHRPTNSLQYEL